MGDKPFLGMVLPFIPAVGWIRAYKAKGFPRDLIAGLSLAAFVIPESLAYASLAQLPPVTGLYCYLVAGIAYAVFGTSRQLAVGPTSALAITVATSVVVMAGGDPSRALALASALAVIVGAICIAGRFIGLANIAYFISDAILIGFKTGAALYIASTQLPKLFGIEGITGNVFERFGHVAMSLHETHSISLAVGLAAIALFVTLERIFPGRPTTLFVVVLAIAMMSMFGLADTGIKIVGDIPAGLPAISVPTIHLSDISALVPIALACVLLAYGETISVARSFAQKHGYDISPEQELTALGAANLATGFAHGFPVAGGMSQTAVNDMGGASSPFSLLVTSGAIALTLMFFAKFFHNLPEPVLAAVVLMAASHMVRFDDLRQLRFSSRREFRISLVALFGVLLFGLLDGLLLAAAGSLIMVIAYASRPPVVVLGRDPVAGHFVSRARYPEAAETPGALVIRSAGAWFYFNADHIRRQTLELLNHATSGIKKVVIDFSLVPAVDVTAGGVLRGLARSLRERGIAIELAGLRDDVRENLTAVGAEQDLGPIFAHRTIEDCLTHRTESPTLMKGLG
ncbi:MAG: SulP family inorganic anion transporter [Afipia sp.]|jgi:high affinity sulfate transporter 1|nr:SulP family inorganic anion transporter [Afipia sp.]MBS4004638.1 SulP family inorganic anion transporter [Afipia sp.]WIG52701.1 MAG: Sulfate permease [Afipia sp.]